MRQNIIGYFLREDWFTRTPLKIQTITVTWDLGVPTKTIGSEVTVTGFIVQPSAREIKDNNAGEITVDTRVLYIDRELEFSSTEDEKTSFHIILDGIEYKARKFGDWNRWGQYTYYLDKIKG